MATRGFKDLFPNNPPDPSRPPPDYDPPYDGLDAEMQRGTLTHKQVRRLSFVKWSLARKRGHYSDYPEEDNLIED